MASDSLTVRCGGGGGHPFRPLNYPPILFNQSKDYDVEPDAELQTIADQLDGLTLLQA